MQLSEDVENEVLYRLKTMEVHWWLRQALWGKDLFPVPISQALTLSKKCKLGRAASKRSSKNSGGLWQIMATPDNNRLELVVVGSKNSSQASVVEEVVGGQATLLKRQKKEVRNNQERSTEVAMQPRQEQ